ncbi:hypothetical protein N9D31_01115 [Oligoflexaceae bacterium]|nr:hypothetical protein [Oligoflexaceae bacterium]
MEKAVAELGIEDIWKTPHVLVAGTNGKGTTSGYIWSLLSHFGHSPGLYSSPHIFSICERFLGPEKVASDEEVQSALFFVKNGFKQYESLSFFDVSTLIALVLFRRWSVKSFVLEVGLGGRLDSTNCSDPAVSVISSIGLDHEKILGEGVETIAAEKAGIIRKNRPVVIGSSCSIPSPAERVIRQCAIKNNARLVQIGEGESASFLDHNWLLAKKAVEIFLELPEISSVAELEKVRDHAEQRCPTFIGRMQVIDSIESQFGKSRITIDVGHNMQCLDRLVRHMSQQPKGLVAFTCFKDKPWKLMLKRLLETEWSVQVFSSDHERSLSKEDFASEFADVPHFGNFKSLWHSLRKREENVILTGSLMGLSEAIYFLSETSPSSFPFLGERA